MEKYIKTYDSFKNKLRLSKETLQGEDANRALAGLGI